MSKLDEEDSIMAYEDSIKTWKAAYTDVLKVCDKYTDFRDKYSSNFGDIHDLVQSAKDHLMLIEWYEKYGLKVEHDYKPYSYNYLKLNDYLAFNYFNDAKKEKDSGKGGRYISWPDDDRQPKNEWLFCISFPTGAYIFGQDYDGQEQLFQDFFNELKSYKPDHTDSHNSSLYWKLDGAKPIYEAFNSILQKYRELNTTELKQREADRLREKLAKLDSELTA